MDPNQFFKKIASIVKPTLFNNFTQEQIEQIEVQAQNIEFPSGKQLQNDQYVHIIEKIEKHQNVIKKQLHVELTKSTDSQKVILNIKPFGLPGGGICGSKEYNPEKMELEVYNPELSKLIEQLKKGIKKTQKGHILVALQEIKKINIDKNTEFVATYFSDLLEILITPHGQDLPLYMKLKIVELINFLGLLTVAKYQARKQKMEEGRQSIILKYIQKNIEIAPKQDPFSNELIISLMITKTILTTFDNNHKIDWLGDACDLASAALYCASCYFGFEIVNNNNNNVITNITMNLAQWVLSCIDVHEARKTYEYLVSITAFYNIYTIDPSQRPGLVENLQLILKQSLGKFLEDCQKVCMIIDVLQRMVEDRNSDSEQRRMILFGSENPARTGLTELLTTRKVGLVENKGFSISDLMNKNMRIRAKAAMALVKLLDPENENLKDNPLDSSIIEGIKNAISYAEAEEKNEEVLFILQNKEYIFGANNELKQDWTKQPMLKPF